MPVIRLILGICLLIAAGWCVASDEPDTAIEADDADRTLTVLEEAVATAEEQGDPQQIVAELLALGRFMRERRDLCVEALVPLRRALLLLESIHGPNSPELIPALDALTTWDGLDYQHLRRNPELLEEQQVLLERWVLIVEDAYGRDAPQLGKPLNKLGHLSYADSSNNWEMRASYYERGLKVLDGAGESYRPLLGTILQNYGWGLGAMGNYKRAESLLLRASEIGEGIARVWSLNDLAFLFYRMGRYHQAKPLMEEVLKALEEQFGPNSLQLDNVLNPLSYVTCKLELLDDCRKTIERELAIFELNASPNRRSFGGKKMQLANVLRRMGRREQAERLLDETRAGVKAYLESVETPDPIVARVLQRQGTELVAFGRYEEAREVYELALEIREARSGRDAPQTFSLLLNLADLAMTQGRLEEVHELLERVRRAKEERAAEGKETVMADVLGPIAVLEDRRGRPGPALDAALGAAREQISRTRLVCRGLPEVQALGFAESRNFHVMTGLALSQLAKGSLHSEEFAARVWDMVVRSRALVLDELSMRQRVAYSAGDQSLRQLAAELQETRESLAYLTLRKPSGVDQEAYPVLLAEARREKEQAEVRLAAQSERFRSLITQSRVEYADVVAALPAGSAVVAYVRYTNADSSSYLAFVLVSGNPHPWAVPLGEAAEIDSLVSAWRTEAASPGAGDKQSLDGYLAAGVALRRRVWDPVRDRLEDVEQVFVVPDAALHLVNLAALPLHEARFLVETGPLLHYISAERDIVAPIATPDAHGLLAMGGADFATGRASNEQPSKSALPVGPGANPVQDTIRARRSACGDFRSLRFEPLPETRREVESIAGLWDEVNDAEESILLTGPAASERAFKVQAPGHRLVHLATHGFFLGQSCPSSNDGTRGIGGLTRAKDPVGPSPVPSKMENPLLRSGLAFAGADRREQARSGEDDGILTAEEIAALDLSGTEWAVLSACDTGVGDIRAGEGVFGLRRAFQMAGVGTLIMSLWSVDDESTREWMTLLYDARLRGRLSTAESVREASLTALETRREAGASTHPFYWAAFVATGDWN